MPAVSFHSATFVEGKSGIGLLLILGGKKEIKNETAVESITVTEDTVIALDTGVSFSVNPKNIAYIICINNFIAVTSWYCKVKPHRFSGAKFR